MEKIMGIRQEVAFKKNSEVFKRLEEVANVATLTPQQRYDYEADLKIYRDTINQIRGAYANGEEVGMERGIEIGRAEGEDAERRKSIRLMLSFGVPAEKIAGEYGISIEDVLNISDSN